ncbi:PREDICTED: aldehyde oxidase-like [Nanorana parkeri]|uniref:aldehyde oxidase-like n=1 Tax=Nanorana parkeri TaxID=125878 RepID=UPI00085454F5|nr:PREDICTED: aldehyde oxidase-like [Nanorana parkeri]
MTEEQRRRTSVLQGDKSKWITPSCLPELLQLKSLYPLAPLVVGNTLIGPPVNLTESFYPVIISPARVPELSIVNFAEKGITIGAACSLALIRSFLCEAVSQIPAEKTKLFQVILQQLAGPQIRSEASLGGSILSESSTWDLNPILAVGNCTFNLASENRKRQVTLKQLVFDETGASALRPEEILISINVPFSKKWEFVSAFRQVQRWGSTAPTDIAAMRVMLKEGTDLIMSMNIYYGGSESACMFAKHVSEMLVGRRWDETMLDEACRLFLEETPLQESAFGMVEYERTLAISFLFQFYLQVSKELKKTLHFPHSDTADFQYTTVFSKSAKQFHQQTSNGFLTNKAEHMTHPYEEEEPVNFQPHALQTITEEDDGDTSIVDGELFLALVTSTRHHAKIISITTEDALKAPGVVDVITSADVPGISNSNLFAENEVTYIGQAICAVVANTQDHANTGAQRVRVEYEDQEPVILSIQDSIKHNSFFGPLRKLEHGNVDEAFECADHILEGEEYIEGQNGLLQSQTVRVIPRIEENEIEVFISTQDPASIQAAVASALNIPSDYILCCLEKRKHTELSHTASQAAITAVAAHKTSQTVSSVIQHREKSFILRHQPPFFGKYKVGYMDDGRIVALDVTYYCNAGHRPDESFQVLTACLLSAQNAYSIPNSRCTVVPCKTNLPSKKFYSEYGFALAAMLPEIWIDTVADRCGVLHEKVRHLNLYKEHSETPFKGDFNANSLLDCWDECLKKSSYHQRRAAAAESNKVHAWRKQGFSIIPVMFPAGLIANFLGQASVLVHICTDGWVLVTPAGSDLAKETLTKMMQVVSREFRVPMAYIRISETGTAFAIEKDVQLSSYDVQVHLMAVQEACQTLLKRLQPIICLHPNATWKECIQEAFRLKVCLSAAFHYRSPDQVSDWELKTGTQNPDFIFGAACTEVELDCRTGNHKNLRTDVVIDVGSTMNEAEVTEQVKNALNQGLGLYINEDLKYVLPSSFTNGGQSIQAAAVSSKYAPEQLSVSLLPSSPNPNVKCSPKALEEVSLFLGSSVFFAIKDAILAARQHIGLPGTILLPIPARPQHIRMACGNHLIEAEQTSNTQEPTVDSHTAET